MSEQLSPLPFLGKVIAITGAGSGIGLATSLLLYSRGATLAVADNNQKSLEELEHTLKQRHSEPGQQLVTTLVDITQEAEVNEWIQSVVKQFGQLDHVANVAGAAHALAPMAEQSTACFDFAIDVNLKGCFNCMRAQLPHLRPGSSIVNVSAGAGLQGLHHMSLYSAAKGGVNTLTTAVAREYGPKGIRVNAVAPGVVLTPGTLKAPADFLQPLIATTPLGRGAQPIEVAKAISFLLSDEASNITGVILRCDGGFLSLSH